MQRLQEIISLSPGEGLRTKYPEMAITVWMWSNFIFTRFMTRYKQEIWLRRRSFTTNTWNGTWILYWTLDKTGYHRKKAFNKSNQKFILLWITDNCFLPSRYTYKDIFIAFFVDNIMHFFIHCRSDIRDILFVTCTWESEDWMLVALGARVHQKTVECGDWG